MSRYVMTNLGGLGAANPAQASVAAAARVERIRQGREAAKVVRARNRAALHNARVTRLYDENAAYWQSINPEWTKYGPERILVSRGDGQVTLGALDATAGLAVGSVLIGGLVTFGMTYLACRLAMKK